MKIGLDFCNFSFFWLYEFFMRQINLFSEGNIKNICILMTCTLINYKTTFRIFFKKCNFTTFAKHKIVLKNGNTIPPHLEGIFQDTTSLKYCLLF